MHVNSNMQLEWQNVAEDKVYNQGNSIVLLCSYNCFLYSYECQLGWMRHSRFHPEIKTLILQYDATRNEVFHALQQHLSHIIRLSMDMDSSPSWPMSNKRASESKAIFFTSVHCIFASEVALKMQSPSECFERCSERKKRKSRISRLMYSPI